VIIKREGGEVNREKPTNSFAFEEVKSSLDILHTMTSHSATLSRLNTHRHTQAQTTAALAQCMYCSKVNTPGIFTPKPS